MLKHSTNGFLYTIEFHIKGHLLRNDQICSLALPRLHFTPNFCQLELLAPHPNLQF